MNGDWQMNQAFQQVVFPLQEQEQEQAQQAVQAQGDIDLNVELSDTDDDEQAQQALFQQQLANQQQFLAQNPQFAPEMFVEDEDGSDVDEMDVNYNNLPSVNTDNLSDVEIG